jgi:hypothetical protein
MRNLYRKDKIEMVEKSSLNYSLLLKGTLLLVGVHSVLLGGIIYFYTSLFYQFFFSVAPDNLFFIKQSGLFLFLQGLFYLIPVKDIKHFRLVIAPVLFSKVTAVAFLLSNAHMTPSPPMIYLAALGDGLMATIVLFFTVLCYKNKAVPFDS